MQGEGASLVILAAGLGARYGGPKQLEGVGPGGELLLDYAIYDAVLAGFTRVVLVVPPGAVDRFRERVQDTLLSHVPVSLAPQDPDLLPMGHVRPRDRTTPWGTAHAVLAALPFLNEPFGVVNADDFYGRQSYRRLGAWLGGRQPCRAMGTSAALRPGPPGGASSPQARGCVVGFRLDGTLSPAGGVSRALCRVSRTGTLESVQELVEVRRAAAERTQHQAAGLAPIEGRSLDGEPLRLTGEEKVSMNMWGFTPDVLPLLEGAFAGFLEDPQRRSASEFHLPTAVGGLVAEGLLEVAVLTSGEAWFGMTHRSDLGRVRERVRALVAGGAYPERLFEGA